MIVGPVCRWSSCHHFGHQVKIFIKHSVRVSTNSFLLFGTRVAAEPSVEAMHDLSLDLALLFQTHVKNPTRDAESYLYSSLGLDFYL